MLTSNDFQQCISYPLKLKNKNILDSTEGKNTWTVRARVFRMKAPKKCVRDVKIITNKTKIRSLNLDGVLLSVDNVLRRSRRLHNQRINEIRKFRRNQSENGLEDIDTFTDDVINGDDPLVRVRDSSEFVMHYGGSPAQELFMKCLGMQRSKNPNQMVMGANFYDKVYVNDEKLPETSAISTSNNIASKDSFEASGCNSKNSNYSLPCSQNNIIEDTVSSSICNILEDVFMIYPHDLLSHDPHEMNKLHEEHNWRLREIMRIPLDS